MVLLTGKHSLTVELSCQTKSLPIDNRKKQTWVKTSWGRLYIITQPMLERQDLAAATRKFVCQTAVCVSTGKTAFNITGSKNEHAMAD